jgi:biotin carboxylase
VVVIVGGGLMQLEAVFAAHRLGYAAVVTDRNPSAPCTEVADLFATIDIHDVEAHIELVDQLRRDGVDVRGILAEGIDAEVTCARVAGKFNFAWMSHEAAAACNDKVLMRYMFDIDGAPELRVRWQVGNPNYIGDLHVLNHWPLPFVLKPARLSASRGVSVVRSREEIGPAMGRLLQEAGKDAAYLVEEYLEGQQQSVELLFLGDGSPARRLNIVDRMFLNDGEPGGAGVLEVGHVNPSQLHIDTQDEIFELAELAANALGVTVGAFKCDTVLTEDGPRILEVAGRLSGGFDSQLTTPMATGRDFIGAAILVACRDPRVGTEAFDALLRNRWERIAVCEGVFVDSEIVVGPEARQPGVWVSETVARVFRYGPGAQLQPAEHCAQRVGFGIGVADTLYDADLLAAQAAAEIGTYYRQWAADDLRVTVVEDE